MYEKSLYLTKTEPWFCVTQELKRALVAEATTTNRDRLIVTASVPAEKATIDACYEVAQIAMYLDFINVLTFDFHSPDQSYSNTVSLQGFEF